MKRKIAFILILFSLLCTIVAAESGISEYYTKTVHIAKIYPHKLGYKVVYVKGDNTTSALYAPMEWFRQIGGYGEIIYGSSAAYPYMTVYFKAGEVSHFRLYVLESFQHESWGATPREDYTEEFSAETPIFEF